MNTNFDDLGSPDTIEDLAYFFEFIENVSELEDKYGELSREDLVPFMIDLGFERCLCGKPDCDFNQIFQAELNRRGNGKGELNPVMQDYLMIQPQLRSDLQEAFEAALTSVLDDDALKLELAELVGISVGAVLEEYRRSSFINRLVRLLWSIVSAIAFLIALPFVAVIGYLVAFSRPDDARINAYRSVSKRMREDKDFRNEVLQDDEDDMYVVAMKKAPFFYRWGVSSREWMSSFWANSRLGKRLSKQEKFGEDYEE